jgi:hypothetical protein
LLFRDVGDFDTPAEHFSDFSSGLRFELSLAVTLRAAALAARDRSGRALRYAGCGRRRRHAAASGAEAEHGSTRWLQSVGRGCRAHTVAALSAVVTCPLPPIMRLLVQVLIVATLSVCLCVLCCAARPRKRRILAAVTAAALCVAMPVIRYARAPPLCPHQPVFLSAAVMFRTFDADLEQYTLRDVEEWMAVMRFGGVQHFYVYDQCHSKDECQPALASSHADVTYRRWPPPSEFDFEHPPHHWETDDYSHAQYSAYLHAANTYRACSEWQITMDIDEYPYSRADQKPGYISRAIKQYAGKPGRYTSLGSVTQLVIQNQIFMGQPSRPDKPSRIGRNIRRAPRTAGVAFRTTTQARKSRVKSIYRCDDLQEMVFGNPHVFRMEYGRTRLVAENTLTAFHYWGWRGDASDPPSKAFLANTVEDNAMDAIIAQIPLLQNPPPGDHRVWTHAVTRHNTENDRTPEELRDKERRDKERRERERQQHG